MANSVLSKIKIGNVLYDLKDAKARADMATLLGENALAALHAAAWKDVQSSASLVEGGLALPTEGAVKSYVDSAVQAIPTFDVVIAQADSEGKPNVQPSADTFHKIYLVAQGAISGTYAEWITIRSGVDPNYTYAWEKIGTTAIDLADYVQKTRKVAGIDLADDITVQELQQALELGALAYADTASGSTTLDTIDSISMKSLTVEGNATVTHTSANASLTKGDYTPAGSVSVTLDNADSEGKYGVLKAVATAGTLPSKAADTFSAGTLPSKAADSFEFTANTPTTLDTTKFSGGSLGSATTAKFASEGLVGSVPASSSEYDGETLVLVAATKADAVTAQGTFTPAEIQSGFYSEGSAASASFTEGTFSQGSLPSFSEGAFSAGAMPTFTTGEVGIHSASFAGTKAENVLVTAVAYDKADATAAFSETVTPEVNALTKTAKTIAITVSPDAGE